MYGKLLQFLVLLSGKIQRLPEPVPNVNPLCFARKALLWRFAHLIGSCISDTTKRLTIKTCTGEITVIWRTQFSFLSFQNNHCLITSSNYSSSAVLQTAHYGGKKIPAYQTTLCLNKIHSVYKRHSSLQRKETRLSIIWLNFSPIQTVACRTINYEGNKLQWIKQTKSDKIHEMTSKPSSLKV